MPQTPQPPKTDAEWRTSEHVAHVALLLIADHPATIGPMRCARIIGGFAVPHTDDEHEQLLSQYVIADLGWPLRTILALVNALEAGGLATRSSGPRPRLVLTRAGHRALEALEHTGSTPC